jgi:hypothetical protein
MSSSLQTRIKLCMDRRPGLRPAEIARQCKVKPPSVWGWINGDTKSMSTDTSRRAADLFGCDQNWLATGTGGPNWRDLGVLQQVEGSDAPGGVLIAQPGTAAPDEATLPDDARVLARHFDAVQCPARDALLVSLLYTIQRTLDKGDAQADAAAVTYPAALRPKNLSI